MKDFNELISEDREFRVRDEVFTWQDLRPEALEGLLAVFQNGDGESVTWSVIDTQIMLFIPGQEEKWKKLRARKEDPVTAGQINALMTWLIGEQSGNRPTPAPSPSDPGPGSTAASSTAA